MVIDASAILAILLKETGRDAIVDALQASPVRLMSAVNALEAALVIEARKGPAGAREFDLLLHRAGIDVVPFTPEQFEGARSAWRKYGKGNHPARLNIGDCCAYALSKLTGEPLLFKGEDFARTDLVPAIADPRFRLRLEKTYYEQGFFNVPVSVDAHVGPHGTKVHIMTGQDAAPLPAQVNRTANRNATARIMGGRALRNYFRAHYQVGDSILVTILSPDRLRLALPPPEHL